MALNKTLKWIAKRVYHVPGLLRFVVRRWWLGVRGARICSDSALSPLRTYGPLRNLTVGSGSFVGRVVLHLHDVITVGENVVINDGVTIFTASHDVNSPDFLQTRSSVMIEEYAWICTGAAILPGVKIGRGSVVGAFAVVTHDVLPLTVVAGNPAKVIKNRECIAFRYCPVSFLAPFEAWLPPRAAGDHVE